MMRSCNCFPHVSIMLTITCNREISVIIKNVIILNIIQFNSIQFMIHDIFNLRHTVNVSFRYNWKQYIISIDKPCLYLTYFIQMIGLSLLVSNIYKFMFKCVSDINFAAVSAIFLLDFETVLTVWYILDFHFYYVFLSFYRLWSNPTILYIN